MHYTYYGANSWLLELGGYRVLVDPWLVGSLVFGNAPWFFKGDRHQPIDSLPENIDLILLSQGLPDHAHPPTLEKLDRQIPVIASPSAAKLVKSLGYSHITTLAPGETTEFANTLHIQALSGAPIGLQVENGYLLTETTRPLRLYYEPHGFPPSTLHTIDPVDVVISPVMNLGLPVVGPIIKGNDTALPLAQQLSPKLFLSTAVGGDVVYTGILDQFLQTAGTIEAFQAAVSQQNLPTQVIDPLPYQRCRAV
ncbi:MAG: MBL fold metallo-hydrolase [Symploca sp. SIO2B6]|nr:MBL fold metallo-hydrolase [Symploca sp. SIO2B6]